MVDEQNLKQNTGKCIEAKTFTKIQTADTD